jgi:hypothetical protein
VDVSDASPIREVALSINGQELAKDASAPYAFLIDPLAGPAGTHTISATAKDLPGNSSAPRTINLIFDHGQDTSPPSVVVTSPAPGVTVGTKTTLTFRVDDPEGLRRVSIQLDGQSAGGADASGNGARVEVDIDPAAQGLAAGAHTLGVSVRNTAGLVATTTFDFTVP